MGTETMAMQMAATMMDSGGRVLSSLICAISPGKTREYDGHGLLYKFRGYIEKGGRLFSVTVKQSDSDKFERMLDKKEVSAIRMKHSYSPEFNHYLFREEDSGKVNEAVTELTQAGKERPGNCRVLFEQLEEETKGEMTYFDFTDKEMALAFTRCLDGYNTHYAFVEARDFVHLLVGSQEFSALCIKPDIKAFKLDGHGQDLTCARSAAQEKGSGGRIM